MDSPSGSPPCEKLGKWDIRRRERDRNSEAGTAKGPAQHDAYIGCSAGDNQQESKDTQPAPAASTLGGMRGGPFCIGGKTAEPLTGGLPLVSHPAGIGRQGVLAHQVSLLKAGPRFDAETDALRAQGGSSNLTMVKASLDIIHEDELGPQTTEYLRNGGMSAPCGEPPLVE